MNQTTAHAIPFLAEIESAKTRLKGVLDASQDSPQVINDLIMIFDLIAERENPADTWIFAEELQMFLFSQTDDCFHSLIDYKDRLKRESIASVLDLSAMTTDDLGTQDAAKCLSGILRSSATSDELYNAVLSMIADLENNLPDESDMRLESLQYSPEYLERLFDSFAKTEDGE